jgi:DNA-binding MarR family transcriptional regulator
VPAAVTALRQFLDGPTIQHLAGVLGLTHSGAVRLVTRLEAERLAVRRPGPDGRSQSIQLTATGRSVADQIAPARADVITAVLEGLDVKDRRALAGAVDTMIATITTRRLDARSRGEEPRGWLCRLCDFADCGRAAGRCPALNARR